MKIKVFLVVGFLAVNLIGCGNKKSSNGTNSPPDPMTPLPGFSLTIAGMVEAVGEGVSGFAVGDRVIGLCGNGGLTEKVAVQAFNCFKMPDAMSYEDGSAILLTYGTSIHAYKNRAHIKSGDVVLVLGGAGGIGISAIELAKAYGARVVAGVSSEASLPCCSALPMSKPTTLLLMERMSCNVLALKVASCAQKSPSRLSVEAK